MSLQSDQSFGSSLNKLLSESTDDQIVLLLMSECAKRLVRSLKLMLSVLDVLVVLIVDV